MCNNEEGENLNKFKGEGERKDIEYVFLPFIALS